MAQFPVLISVLGIILLRILPAEGIKCYSCSNTTGPSCQQPSGPKLIDCDKELVKITPGKNSGNKVVVPFDQCMVLESGVEFTNEGKQLLLLMGCTTKSHTENLSRMHGVRKCGFGITTSECITFLGRFMWTCTGDGCNYIKQSTGNSKPPCYGDDCNNGQNATRSSKPSCSGCECNNGNEATGNKLVCHVVMITVMKLLY